MDESVPAVVRKKKANKKDALAVASTNNLLDLFERNTRVQELRNANDLLERLIMDPDGTDLRVCVARIGALLQTNIAEFNRQNDQLQQAWEQCNNGAVSSFMNLKMAADDVRSINHMFQSCLEGNPNDDKARVAQLAILFTALTIEVDVRQQLTEPPVHVDRFKTTEQTVADETPQKRARAMEARQKERSNQIQRVPLTMFLKNDARHLLTQYSESQIDIRHYVTECVTAYMSYKPAVDPHTAQQYYNETQ